MMYLEAKQQLLHCEAFNTTIKSIDPRAFLPPQRDVFPGSAGAKVLLTPDHKVRICDNDGALLAAFRVNPDSSDRYHTSEMLYRYYSMIFIFQNQSKWSIFYAVFPEKKSLEACWDKDVPNEVGSLRVGYILASLYGTADIVESGPAVSDTPGNCSMISKGPS
ncbi:unnamed protein product [Penicillium viridicatum]